MEMNSDSSVCRVCLFSDPKSFCLQKTDVDRQYTFLEMFNACTHLEALEIDGFPQFICQGCTNDLQITFDFLCKAAASDRFFKDQSNELKIEDENVFEFEEGLQHEDELEETPIELEDENSTEKFEPVEYETICLDNDNNKGFDRQFEQFVHGKLASECIFLDSAESSDHPSDAEIVLSNIETETEEKESKLLQSLIVPGHKISSDSKKSSAVEGQSVECNVCGKILKQISIKHHLKRCQKEEKLYLCSSCPKSFAVRCDLKNHMRTHDKERERKFICSECGKGFFEKQSLKVHMTRHLGDKEYQCTICPKKFATKKSLDVHEFTHNRELGRFVCKHCDKRFPSKADLIVHERFHTGDYPFQCEFCDKKYAVKSHYNYHLAKHKGVTYKCDQCDKEFMNRGSLTAHKFKHNERMPHECSICKKGFASPYKLNRHKSCHKAKEEIGEIK